MTAYADARQAYKESSILTAPPERLVLLLYDGAIRFLGQAAEATRAGDLELARARTRRAGAIIDELNLSLDMSYGELPERLRGIYLFCKRHLLESSVRRDPAAIERVASLLAELRDAWVEVAGQGVALAAER